eukprot:g17998.t1
MRAASILLTKRSKEKKGQGQAALDTCASHNPIPGTVFRDISKYNPGGVKTRDLPVKFGTVGGDDDDPHAPTAFLDTEQHFLVNSSPVVFVDTFQVVDGGTVGNFPPILGQPFIKANKCVIDYEADPACVHMRGSTYGLCDAPTAMLELRFITRDDAQQRWVPPSASKIFYAEQGTKEIIHALVALTTAATSSHWSLPRPRGTTVGTVLLNSGGSTSDADLVGDAASQAATAGSTAADSSLNDESMLEVDPVEAERVRQMYEFMRNEHIAMGHQKAAEFLYSGDALKLLQQVRADCKLCAFFDEAEIVRQRGSLQQFAVDRNHKWIIDLISTKLGSMMKIIDACTRKKGYELCDGRERGGGQTATAIKLFMRCKRVFGGAPREIYFDIGGTFVSRRFKKVLEFSNTTWHEIGFKEAWRISKLEKGNREDKRRLNKLLSPPFQPFLELFIWGLAQQRLDEEIFYNNWEEVIEDVIATAPDSGEFVDEWEVRCMIVGEMEYQANNVPQLGTTVTPDNAHYGTFNRGLRDWEEQWIDHEASAASYGGQMNAFIERNGKIQNVCRTIIRERDIENFGRRRELVGRIYQRGSGSDSFEIGQMVYVRREQTGKFARWIGGIVESINNADKTVTVRVGSNSIPYGFRDVAALQPRVDADEPMEFYPDKHLLELVQDRGGVVVFDDDEIPPPGTEEGVDLHTRRKDVFTAVRDGVSTYRTAAAGSVDDHQHCTACGKKFTSLRRFMQHAAKCPGSWKSNYQRDAVLGLRREPPLPRPAQSSLSSVLSNGHDDAVLGCAQSSHHGLLSDDGVYEQPPSSLNANIARHVGDLLDLDDDGLEPAVSAPDAQADHARGGSISSDNDGGAGPPSMCCHTTESLPREWKDSGTVEVTLKPEERFVESGLLHPKLLHALNESKTTAELVFENGSAFLTAPLDVPDSDVVQAIDFAALPDIAAVLDKDGRSKQRHQLMSGPNDMVFKASQFLNGACIRDKMNFKDNRREFRFAVTEVDCYKDGVTGHPGLGQVYRVRWGSNHTPTFENEADSKRQIPGTWVMLMYFESCTEAHQALETFTKDVKSSSIVVTVADAERLGFLSYVYPAIAEEMRVINKHKIFGREKKLSELKRARKNVVTSRFLLVVKVCRISGEILKVKGRWVTQGFRDVRFKRTSGEAPPSRSHTIADSSIALLCQYFQSTAVTPMVGDIKEAFLRGKRMIQMCDRVDDIEVRCAIPSIVQSIEVSGCPVWGEARDLDKALYGQPDAPAGWEITFNDHSEQVGFTQSLVDPSVWMYFLNTHERKVQEAGPAAVEKYFGDKVREIMSIPRDDLRARVRALEQGAEQESFCFRQWSQDNNLVNPQSVQFVDALLPHYQREHRPDGVYGTHVDDVLGGGGLFFHLRLFTLIDCFELGSFSILGEATRDTYVGRELAVMPFLFDQVRVAKHLEENAVKHKDSNLQLPAGAVVVPTEAELVLLEERLGVKRDAEATALPEATKIKFDPFVVAANHRMLSPVVYYIGQEIYADKIQPLSQTEVETYFSAREQAQGNKWRMGGCKSPFQGRLGELIWLKGNGLIKQSVSELASLTHQAEKCSTFEEVEGYVTDINCVIGISKFRESNMQRVYFLAPLGEHFVFGAADAGKERIGGMPFLAGRGVPRINIFGMWSKAPKRKFNSSGAIETLAQKVLSAELIYLLQLVYDLWLATLGRMFGQLTDSRNALTEPTERNIKPDWQSIAGLVRAKLLQLYHGAGTKMFVDGFTKPFRMGLMWALHLAANCGLIDDELMCIVQKHIESVLETESQKKEMLITDWVKQLEDEDAAVDDSADDAPAETSAPIAQEPHPVAAAAGCGPCFTFLFFFAFLL